MRRIEIVAPRLERMTAGALGHGAPPLVRRTGGVPDTSENVLMVPMAHLSAPRHCKPLNSHDSVTTPRVHHAARRRGCGVATPARAQQGERLSESEFSTRSPQIGFHPKPFKSISMNCLTENNALPPDRWITAAHPQRT